MSASGPPQPADDGHTGEVLAPPGPPDLVHGAFSDEPPWLVDPAAMSWRRRVPALQSVTRDFAFFVPADLTADVLVRVIRGADKAAITAVRLFDRFEGKDGLSLAIEVTLQPGEKSFTESEIAEISQRIVAAGVKLGAKLRG